MAQDHRGSRLEPSPARGPSRSSLTARRGSLGAASIALAITLTTRAGAAAEPPASAATNDRITHDIGVDLPIVFAAGSFWLGTQLMQPVLSHATCRWCDRNDD